MDRLEKFVPAGIPRLILWPGADSKLFHPQPKDELLLARLGIPVNSTILCYTGNVHPVNAREVRSLYLAVAMLNREAMPTTILRAGRDYCPFLGPDEQWARKYAVELGYVKHIDIPRLLSLADVLIQPGTDDVFNEYRLPSKLPEFFAMGRPVILPHTNVGRFVKHGEHAWVIPKVDALGIAESLQHVLKDEVLAKLLSQGAQRFYREHFDWETNAGKLDAFYETVLRERQCSSKPKLAYVVQSGSTRLEVSDVSSDLQELPEVNHARQP